MNPYRGHAVIVHKPHDIWMMSVADEEGKILSTSGSINLKMTDEEHKRKMVERAKGLANWLGIDNVEVRDAE